MNELKYKFESVAPTTLHISSEIATSCFYASTAEDIDARFASLVEVFLLKVYRCKLCQFTSSLKNKVCHHVSNVHQLDQAPLIASSNQEEHDSYGIGEEISQENKINEENLYRMLNTMSPESCSMSLGGQSANTNMVSVSEVNSLFEEEQSEFRLEESVPGETIPPVSTANSPRSKAEDDAQCEHLLSLGLYRISNIRPTAPSRDPKADKSITVQETAKAEIKPTTVTSPSSLPADQCKKADSMKQSYTCTSCQLEFETKDTYKIHVQCHKQGGGFTCLFCGCFMSDWNTMELHIKSHRLVRKSYQCQVCEKRFLTQGAWKSHMRGHDKKSDVFLCTKCPLSFENESVRNLHVTCHHEDVFKCCQCGLVEQEWNKVHEHLSNHDGSMKPFICGTCNQRFSTETQMKAHSSKHKHRRFTTCPLCHQKFKNFSQLNKHQKHFHQQKTNGKKGKQTVENHSSDYLTEDFTSPHSIPKREFTCDICSRRCSSKLALQRHMGVHAGEKPFHCQHCEYKTRLKASLKQHMRVHTGEKPFKCELCSYASIDGSSLRRHVRTHTSEKPYKCLHCSYSCIQKKSLDLHIRRHHTGEMFKCSACQYSSPDKQLLHKHIKKHHGNENSQLTSSSLNTS